MRMRKKKNLPARMECCASVLVSEPESRRGHWLEGHEKCTRLFVELGCGKGRFTVGTAQAERDALIVAVEKVPDAMVIAMERTVAAELDNVLFIDADAARLTELFAPGEVERIYINFCDPWPPKNRAKRRLTHTGFLKLYRELLPEGGEIWFKTDNVPLFDFSLEEFTANGFELRELTRDLHENGVQGIMTDYEAKFHEAGTRINRVVAVKRALPEGEA